MLKSLKKFITVGVIASSMIMLFPVGASAEWKQDNKGWWNTEGNSWSIGWREINGKWYYFGQDGYMVHDTIINGYKIDGNGAWIQNINNTTNNTTNTNLANTTTTESNNMTNLTSNTDSSTKNSLSNTGTINTGIINSGTMTNNINVKVEQDNSYQKQIQKTQEENKKNENAYYKYMLDGAKADLQEAQAQLERTKNQKSVQTLVKKADGTWGYDYVVDKQELQRAEKNVSDAQRRVDYYQSLMK